MQFYKPRAQAGIAAVFLLLFSIVTALPTVTAAAAPDVRVPYTYSVDNINGRHVSGSMISIIRDMALAYGEAIEAEGWVATAEGIASYRYAWVPVGGGAAEWHTVTNVKISSRPDLGKANIPYSSGHGTAGFAMTIAAPEGTPDGFYDVYLCAVDGAGVACDVLALLNLQYGSVDYDNTEFRTVNFSRIQREAATSALGDPVVTEEGLVLDDGDMVKLGSWNLAVAERLRITYRVSPDGLQAGEGRAPVLGLKSDGAHSFGEAGDKYNLTDLIVYRAINADSGEGVVDIDLTQCDYNGDVWLSGYLGGEITVTEIKLFYNGCSANRVAAKIYFSEAVTGYFQGSNHTTLVSVNDPVQGDVLRMEVMETTTDPYIHFNASTLLKEHDIALDADEYKYMVLLYRAEPDNKHPTKTNFYMCAGAIASATEACTKSVTWNADGKWHYLLMDLTQTQNWTGVINGWRFDYLSGESNPGDAVEFASVQFFRTPEAAMQAASVDPNKNTAYSKDQSPVFADMSEEEDFSTPEFTIPPEDSYVIVETEPETEAPTEPAISPEDPGESETAETNTEEGRSSGGCKSRVEMGILVILPAVAILLRKRKKTPYKGETA